MILSSTLCTNIIKTERIYSFDIDIIIVFARKKKKIQIKWDKNKDSLGIFLKNLNRRNLVELVAILYF